MVTSAYRQIKAGSGVAALKPKNPTDRYKLVVEIQRKLKKRGCYTHVHNPIFEARHWGIADGKDVDTPSYHRTHSGYAVAAFHEALRIILGYGRARKSSDYKYHEAALRNYLETRFAIEREEEVPGSGRRLFELRPIG